MGNMSYVRFENTYRDLQDCFEHLWDNDVLSESEGGYRKLLVKLCQDMAEEAEDFE